jgi:Domain of unknown function (DUF932)
MLVEEIYKETAKAKKNVNAIKANLFEVVKMPLITENSIFKAPENVFSVYRSNGGKPLSGNKSLGKDYTPMQPREFLDNIIETVRDYGANLDLSTLQFNEFCGGSKIEFRIKMHPLSFKNNKGLKDITNLEVTFSTSYDGSKSSTISLYTERLVCLNGMVRSGLEGVLKGRNTIGGKAKILSYASEVAQLVEMTEGFKQQMQKLDKIKLTKKQVEAFKLSLLGYNRQFLDESDKAEGHKKQQYEILNLLDKAIQIEFERTGATAFGLLQGVTYYTNHLASRSGIATKIEPSREEYIRFNQGAKTNEKAQDLLFALLEVN